MPTCKSFINNSGRQCLKNDVAAFFLLLLYCVTSKRGKELAGTLFEREHHLNMGEVRGESQLLEHSVPCPHLVRTVESHARRVVNRCVHGLHSLPPPVTDNAIGPYGNVPRVTPNVFHPPAQDEPKSVKPQTVQVYERSKRFHRFPFCCRS